MKRIEKIIALDFDGPVADLHSEWINRYNHEYNDNLSTEDITEWDVTKFVKKECGKKFLNYLLDPDLYDNILPIPGALEGIQELKKSGFRIVYATSCVKGMIDQKINWLYRYNLITDPDRPIHDVISVTDKYLVNADLLIDDRLENVLNFHKKTILFDAPYNRHKQVPNRVSSWDQIPELVNSLFLWTLLV